MKKKLWFKSRLYGYGWIPCSKEGWIIITIYIAVNLITAWIFTIIQIEQLFFLFFIQLIISTLLLIYICYHKGEKPKWQWNKSKKSKK